MRGVYLLAILEMLVIVGGLVDDTQILLEAYHYVSQGAFHVCGKSLPGLLEFLCHRNLFAYAVFFDFYGLVSAEFL